MEHLLLYAPPLDAPPLESPAMLRAALDDARRRLCTAGEEVEREEERERVARRRCEELFGEEGAEYRRYVLARCGASGADSRGTDRDRTHSNGF